MNYWEDRISNQTFDGDQKYRVFVVHNFYNGHCYDYSGRVCVVYGRSSEDALARARWDKELIEGDFRKRRVCSTPFSKGRLLIRKSDKYHLKDRDIHSPHLIG
jgi:hypothetical protein